MKNTKMFLCWHLYPPFEPMKVYTLEGCIENPNLLTAVPYQLVNWYGLYVNQLCDGQCSSNKAWREGTRPILHVLSPPCSAVSRSSLQSLGHISFCSKRMIQTCLDQPGLKAALLPSLSSSHCTPVPIPGLTEFTEVY